MLLWAADHQRAGGPDSQRRTGRGAAHWPRFDLRRDRAMLLWVSPFCHCLQISRRLGFPAAALIDSNGVEVTDLASLHDRALVDVRVHVHSLGRARP